MKFAPNSALMRELELDDIPGVEPVEVPAGMVLCNVCNKPTPKITATKGAENFVNERTGKLEVELLKTERIVGPYDDLTLPGFQTFEKKQRHFSRAITTCPSCSLNVGVVKWPAMRG